MRSKKDSSQQVDAVEIWTEFKFNGDLFVFKYKIIFFDLMMKNTMRNNNLYEKRK